MNCHELAERIERLYPTAAPAEVARLCLLLANQQGNLDDIDDDARLADAWQAIGIRLQAAADQHAAMTAELESVAAQAARGLAVEQIWTLIRAIKVQSQILQLYVGPAPPETTR